MENCDKYRFDEMFHVKHFIICFIIALSFNTVKCQAASNHTMDYILQNYSNVVWLEKKDGTFQLIMSGYPFIVVPNNQNPDYPEIYSRNSNVNQYFDYSFQFSNGIYFTEAFIENENNLYLNSTLAWSGNNVIKYIVVKGSISGVPSVSWDQYSNVPWYKNIWNVFTESLANAGSWIYNQANNLGKIIKQWWNPITVKPDPGGGTAGHTFVKATPIPAPYETTVFPTLSPIPTLSPTPLPTPIPVTTVIKDDGNGNSTIMYVYTNPEGTPTESPYNPNGNTYNNYINTNNNINTSNEVYVKDGTSPNWQDIIGYDEENNTSISFNIGDLDNNTDMFTVPLQESASDVGEAVSGFASLPDNILLIIGCIACIPLIAGIIGRLLK